MKINKQLMEIASWRLLTEMVRRSPDLRIYELHPGGGQYDCLAKDAKPLIYSREISTFGVLINLI
jgi:hypothetical protein